MIKLEHVVSTHKTIVKDCEIKIVNKDGSVVEIEKGE